MSRATSGATGPTPGILQVSPCRTSLQPRAATSWLTSTTSSGLDECGFTELPEKIVA
jgi:hypothetical protein